MTGEEASEFLDPCSTPAKLALDSFPRRAECPGMATPPIRPAGAVPFKWEEAPGRPMQESNRHTPAGSASAAADAADRHLGLPPRLSASAATKEERRSTVAVSRAAVIDGPYFLIRRPLSFTFGGKERKGKKVSWDVSSEKSSTATEDTAGSSASSSSSFNSSSVGSVCSYSNGEGGSEGEEEEGKEAVDEGKEEERKVRVLRYKRKRTLTCVTSHTASQLWASIFGRLKHAVVTCKRAPKV